MKERACQIVSKEELVAYADGNLSASEAERIAEHVATCPDCQAVLEALERSLQVAQAIWKTGQAQWPETRSFDKIRANRRSFRKVIALAASVLLLLASSILWRVLPEAGDHTRTISEDEKIAELRLKIADSSDAARLLAAAELLSRYPEAESRAKQRYRRIVDAYPGTAAATQAKLKLQ